MQRSPKKNPKRASRRVGDVINSPTHYISHPAGVECIDIVEWLPFNIGAAIKYLWRADLKDTPTENLEKAIWFIQREIVRRKKQSAR